MKADKEKEADQKLKELLRQTSIGLEGIGFVNPMRKVYNLTKDLDYFPLGACLITLQVLSQLRYDDKLFTLVIKNKEAIADGPPFIAGVLTIFRQYHIDQYKKYLMYLEHFIKCTILNSHSGQSTFPKAVPSDAVLTMSYLEEILRFDGSSRELVKQQIGTYLFDYFKV